MKSILCLCVIALSASNAFAQGRLQCSREATKAVVQLWILNDQNYFGLRPMVVPGPVTTTTKLVNVKPSQGGSTSEYNVTTSNNQSVGSYNVLVKTSKEGCFVSAILSNN